MTKVATILAGTALGLCLAAGQASAGPCTEQLNEVARTLANNPAMGAPTSGALAGAAPGAIEGQAPQPTAEARSVDPAPSLSEGGKTSGSAGMSEMNAASNQVATSPQDVRLQQTGQPTTAQGGDPTKLDDRATQAKNALEKARMLDAQGSHDCMAAVDEAKRLAGNEQ